jgi:hypothetical protein
MVVQIVVMVEVKCKIPRKVEVNANDRCRREMKKANRHTVMMVIGCKDGSV